MTRLFLILPLLLAPLRAHAQELEERVDRLETIQALTTQTIQALTTQMAAERAHMAVERERLAFRLDRLEAAHEDLKRSQEATAKALFCAVVRLNAAPVLEEIARTDMDALSITPDERKRDLPGARVEIPADIVRGRQVVVQYNFSSYHHGSNNNPWKMFWLVVDGVEQPQARSINSSIHATHSGVWIGQIAAGETPLTVEFEAAAARTQIERSINRPAIPVSPGESPAHGPYESAGFVVYVVSPPPAPEGC